MTQFTMRSKSESETRKIGYYLGRNLVAGDVLLLIGDLGAGKTCLTQGIAKGLGVPGYVRSPTFVLVSVHQGRIPLYHMDMYRLDNIEEVLNLGLEEYLDGEGVSVIEWADKAIDAFPRGCLVVRIIYKSKNVRILDLDFEGNRYRGLLSEVESKLRCETSVY